jgi:NADH dehydrogenase
VSRHIVGLTGVKRAARQWLRERVRPTVKLNRRWPRAG